MAYIWFLLLLLSGSAFATTQAEIKLVSDYTDEGITQSDGDVAWIAGIEQAQDNGFYYGVRALHVDFGDKNQLEWNTYTGYRWEIDEVSFDAGSIIYTYFGDSIQHQFDFMEHYINVDFNNGHSAGFLCSFDMPVNPPDEVEEITHCIATYGYVLPEQVYGFDTVLEVNLASSLDSELSPWGDKKGYLHTKVSFSRTIEALTFFVDFENTWLNDGAKDQGGGFRTILGVSYPFVL